MASDVTMPRLSDSMEEGTVLKWLVEEGGEVKRGEPLVEIETDKANMTYDADADGTLIEVVAQEGDTLAIGEVIARIGDPSEASGDGKPSGGKEAPAEEEAGGEAEGAEAEAGAAAGEGKEAEEGGEGEAAEGDEGEDKAAAEGDGEGEGEEGEDKAAAKGEGDEGERDEAGDDERAGARGEERGGAGADGGGGETQAGAAGTATETRAPSGNGAGAGERVKASPVARRMAQELGVELARLEGTGPGGRIVKADVQAAAKGDGAAAEAAPEKEEERAPKAEEERAPEPQRAEAGSKGAAEIQELTRLQQTVSRRMAESKATAPDFSISLTVDMTQAVELRKRLKEVADPAPSFNDMVVKAAATALREHPRVNGAYRDGKFELYERVNVGVAVAAQDALVVPTVFDADRKSLGQIARDARGLAEKVRDKKITPPELSGATFTVSNLGMFGIEQFTAIINPPQASILTVGKLDKRPAVDESGRIVARDQMTLSLVCDHRILYGADGAQFLARVKELLEQPLSLAL
jgi:pyruvate dehydrogenase E2 component (dihydrolipoamide acetyltransferase)